MTDHRDLPLFAWQPPCKTIAFPPGKRVGKIRDVAQKWLGQRTKAQADRYAIRIDDDLQKQLDRVGILPDERKRLVDAFWTEVKAEIARLKFSGNSRPGGGAA